MKSLVFVLTLLVGILSVNAEQGVKKVEKSSKEVEKMMVVIETSMGTITAELYENASPVTVKNFLAYVDSKFYDKTIFHRVIDGFMIQGGGFDSKMVQKKPTHGPIKNEADNRLSNKRGTLAMARTMIVDSATCQFFINQRDNTFLDFKSRTDQGFGYCVFGNVVEGMEVVDAIAKVRTGFSGPHQNVPVEPVVITSIRRLSAEAEKTAKSEPKAKK